MLRSENYDARTNVDSFSLYLPSEAAMKKKDNEKSKTYGAAFEANVFLVCGCFMVGGYWLSRLWSKNLFEHTDTATRISFVSGTVEQFGLWSLLVKIALSRSVAGLSGKTMIVYLCEYVMRFLVTFDFSATGWLDISFECMYALAVVLVARVLYCVFRKNKETYDASNDAWPVQYHILACFVLPILVQADVQMGPLKNYMWNTCMWLEMSGLLAQVYMIAKAQAPVDALISHFVAATAVSRLLDLGYWYYAFPLVAPDGLNFSVCLILFCHLMHSLLLGDFMYYYAKFRLSGLGGLLSAMPIPEAQQLV